MQGQPGCQDMPRPASEGCAMSKLPPTRAAVRLAWCWLDTWLAARAAVVLQPSRQAARRAGRAGALQADHLRVPALALAAQPFRPFLSVLQKVTPKRQG